MKEFEFLRSDLFRAPDAQLLPERIPALADLKSIDAEIDVVVCAHRFPELTNQVLENYSRHENPNDLHFIVVESSGDEEVFHKLKTGPRVSKILLRQDIKIQGKVHGYGSYGMAVSAAVGSSVGRAPFIFYSHSDMMAFKPGFLQFLKSKIGGEVRLAGFDQRHIIPFSGSMMMRRELFSDVGANDWLPLDTNPFLKGTGLESLAISHLHAVDCGEQYIYRELQQGRPVHVCGARGGKQDWWKDPADYYGIPSATVYKTIQNSKAKIQFAPLQTSPEKFEERYAHVLRAGRERWWLFEKPKWWRYSFDDQGDLIFLHHGRGTTERAVQRWIRFNEKAYAAN